MKASELFDNWVELSSVFIIIVGFALAVIINKAYVSYTVAFLCGLVFGKLIYHKRNTYTAPYVLLAAGFVVGYIVGNRVADTWFIILLFVTANIISYIFHEKKLF
jgi:hypothetical protein